MVALVPVRALAAVTTGFCAFAHSHGHDAPGHEHDSSPCGTCVEHCSSAAFATCFTPASFTSLPSAERSLLHERSVAGFIPDPLDPPPLAS